MEERLMDVMTELVTSAPGADALHLRLVDDFREGELSAAEVDALFEEFTTEFEAAGEIIRKAWGDPSWEGSVEEDDFPDWSEALLLTCWRRGEVVAYLALRHDDDHAPMFLEVGALTDDEVSTLEYTKS